MNKFDFATETAAFGLSVFAALGPVSGNYPWNHNEVAFLTDEERSRAVDVTDDEGTAVSSSGPSVAGKNRVSGVDRKPRPSYNR